jgi:hypothetical protein
MQLRRIFTVLLISFLSLICFVPNAIAFCGFYVAKADVTLYNKASQVVIARDGNRNILTMANDFQGDVKDFAMVVPVPTVLQQDQVRLGDAKIIQRLDAFSAPRLVEYFDSDPCQVAYAPAPSALSGSARGGSESSDLRRQVADGVTIESQFSVGEYDILILSATESDGLENWLNQNGYKMPAGASALLRPYIQQDLKFFVAKVNLKEFQRSSSQFLRPLMMAYESPRFMLPIRLGMINSTNEQDLIAYVLSSKGQAEITNYRTVKVPTDAEIPVYVKEKFGDFYKSMFQTAYDRENQNVAFVEYAWNMSNCDPCSATPLTPEELRGAGVFWLNQNPTDGRGIRRPPNPNNNVFITRIHVRYTRDKFPEDLMFQETSNQQQFQGRYVLRHPFKGEASCEAGQQYRRGLVTRLDREAQTLARLTNWDINDIRRNLPQISVEPVPFWRTIWDSIRGQ